MEVKILGVCRDVNRKVVGVLVTSVGLQNVAANDETYD